MLDMALVSDYVFSSRPTNISYEACVRRGTRVLETYVVPTSERMKMTDAMRTSGALDDGKMRGGLSRVECKLVPRPAIIGLIVCHVVHGGRARRPA